MGYGYLKINKVTVLVDVSLSIPFMGYHTISCNIPFTIIKPFNSLYGIQHDFVEFLPPKVLNFQFPLWDTAKLFIVNSD